MSPPQDYLRGCGCHAHKGRSPSPTPDIVGEGETCLRDVHIQPQP